MKNIVLIICIVFTLKILPQNILNVPSQYSTIQAALNAAQSGDTVLVQPGTYKENIIWPIVNGITLIADGDTSNTIIDGNGSGSVINMISNNVIDSTTELRGFRITNGGNSTKGGGIYLQKSNPKLVNLLICQNNAIDGGGIYLDNSKVICIKLVIRDNNNQGIFIKNSSTCKLINSNINQNYGGIYLYDYSYLFMDDSYILQNKGAGGIFSYYSNIILNNVIIKGNSGIYGGGINFGGKLINQAGIISLDNVLIDQNIAFYDGGGLYLGSSTFLAKNVRISNNSADRGGGVFILQDTLKNCIIYNNSAKSEGGGIWIRHSSILGSIIANNSSKDGGGIFASEYGFNMDSCTIACNNSNKGGAIFINPNNSDVKINRTTFVNNVSASLGVVDSYSNYQSDFINSNFKNNNFAIFNANPNFVTATNNWWGDNSGPYHPTQNSNGKGDSVNQFVNVLPFLTQPNTTAPPIPIQNVKITNTSISSIALNWDASPLGDLKGYKVYWDTDSLGYTYKNSYDVGKNTGYTITGLNSNSTYHIAITCYDNSGNESWFSKELVVATKLASPALSYPANNSTDVSLTPTLSWSTVLGADKYRLEVNTKSDFSGTVIYDQDTVSQITKQVGGLTDSTKYYWRVTALNNSGNSSYTSNVFSFSTAQAVIPDGLFNGGIAVPVSPTLRWNKTPGASRYRLEVNTKTDFTGTVIFDSDNIPDTLQAISGLEYNTFYYALVTAYSNALAKTSTSRLYGFLTELATPVLKIPADSSTNVILTPSLIWSAVFGADKFKLEVNTNPDFSDSVVFNKIVLSDTVQINLNENTRYYWRVTALNTLGNSSEKSVTFTFKTLKLTGTNNAGNIIPDNYIVYQNYPNPFNPLTVIRYALPSESKISIIVYNILGQEIKTLLNTTESAGYHEVNFNAGNLASGIYFYRITAVSTDGKKEFVDVKKLVLMK